jgi:hypothetical protein
MIKEIIENIKKELKESSSVEDVFDELVSNFDEDYIDIYKKYKNKINPCEIFHYIENHKKEFIKEYNKNLQKLKNKDEYVDAKEFYEDVLSYFEAKCRG